MIERRPVITYVVLCYAITWSVWFAIPLFAPGPWTLIKILTGIGLGPGMAAVLLDRARGNAGPIGAKWWTYFAVVFLIVAAVNISSLLTGDGQRASEFLTAVPGSSHFFCLPFS